MPRAKTSPEPKPKPKSLAQEPQLVATSQQSRFHADATNPAEVASRDLDIRTLTIALGKREILSDAELKLQYGTHYAVVGRNGVGKSTLLKAIGEKYIPGIPINLRVLLLGQTLTPKGGDEVISDNTETVLQHVVRSDTHRERALRDTKLLTVALESSSDSSAAAKAVRKLKHESRVCELEEAKKLAAYRSGARGLKARKELRLLEEELDAFLKMLDLDEELDELTVAAETEVAVQMLHDLEASLEAMSASTADSRARTLLLGLGFPLSKIDSPLSSLSGGWKTRCSLARILYQPSDYLLLDEPTNFLDLAAMLWLQGYLQALSSTVLVVTHDRSLADAVADEILVIRDNKLEHFNGNLTSYDKARRANQLRLGRMKDAQERQKAHMKETIVGNIRAAKSSGDDKKLKQAASRQKKLDERMGLEVSAKGTRFKLNRDLPGYHKKARDEIEVPVDDAPVKISLPESPPPLRFPGVLVAFENFSFRYNSMKSPVLAGINLAIHPGARIGILGLNGAGKSTLLSHIVEGREPSGTRTGAITRHPKAAVAYFSQSIVEDLQSLGDLDRSATALSVLLQATEGLFTEQEARGLLGSLGLQGRTAAEIPLALLSGGQKVRLALATLVCSPPHLLVLDEVTTHLDSDTIVALARELNAYEGAVLLVTHDRFFIRAVVQGENPVGEGEDGGRVWDENRRGEVFLLEKGRLEVLTGGVEAYEARAMKVVRRMRVLGQN
ncbi:ATP-binding cassette sub-family F member 3 [Tricharina praecox]|uniref:ATP-binding cassette sub-family F member 3 n=1 Tax=Tricharina praecox TaxID=43433 RepID=UPI00221EA42A|nr:ATP-binding cassette sub-family F member 3 [Tricharina praecox]KAI5848038.1 ATP-binding cassette sub-family F member 3 [Tricharina praecox]